MKYNREDKLRIANQILASEGWKLLGSELEAMINLKEKEIQGYLYDANTHRSFLHEGIKLGLQIALALPEKLQRDNQIYFKRLYEKALNGQ